MFKNLLYNLLEPIIMKNLKKSAAYYSNENFEKISELYPNPIDSVVKSTVYENLFRFLSWMRLGDPIWKSEFTASIRSGELRMLGEHDQKYIEYYISSFLDPTSEHVRKKYFEESLVSKKTKEFFPLLKCSGPATKEYHFIKHDSLKKF